MRSLYVGMAAASVGLVLTLGAAAWAVSDSKPAGAYELTLKVLPAETFEGPQAKMAWDGGAEAVKVDGPEKPNHHLVVFVKKGKTPVEDAKVEIAYRPAGEKDAGWTRLPVARMHERGAGPKTTHYGNNVRLAPGPYEVRVTVNGGAPTEFDVRVGE